MSEEIQETPKKKNYVLLVDDIGMASLRMALPCIQFLEVEGMTMTDNKTHQVIVTPMVTEAPIPDQQEVSTPEQGSH